MTSRHRRQLAAALALLISLMLGASAGAVDVNSASLPEVMHVLFIGNSLTASNDLPLIVEALAKASGRDLQVESVTFGGFSLDDHLREGTAVRKVASQRWDVVVMQHGPSSLPESRTELRASAKRLAPLIRQAGGRPAFFMVWPELERSSFFDAVRDSYSLAASDVKGMFIPAGEAWRAAWRRDPQAPLYSGDHIHPSVAGSYAAALSIYGMLYGRSPEGLPARLTLTDGQVVDVPAALAKLLQEAAGEANRNFGRPRPGQ
jgi:hypothetical protein